MESYKYKSRLITILVTIVIAVLTYVAAMSPETLAQILPKGYEGFAAVIIVIAAAIINQYSEEKRVERAEELIIHKQNTVLGTPIDGGVVLNEEYTTPTEDNEGENGT